MSGADARERGVDLRHGIERLGGDSQVDDKALVLPPGHFARFDPFLIMAEDRFSTPGFDWHPHRGLETVTVVLDGALEHGDNRGNAGVLEPGDVQWMTAGSGIVHRELAYRDEHAHTLQLWVNLPATDKRVEASYQDLPRGRLGRLGEPGVDVQLIAGSLGATSGPARPRRPITALALTLEPGRGIRVELPGEQRAFAYVIAGRLELGPEATGLRAGEVAWSDPVGAGPSTWELAAPDGDEPVRLVVFAGRPIRERIVAYGPFVVNSEEEIREAFADYRAGRFGAIPALARR